MPSKSGIVGLLAAAQGLRRTDPLEELLGLRLAVRTEQPGRIERDFQTAARPGEHTPVSVSTRSYLTDAVFLAAVEGDRAVLEGLQEALRRPHYPLYLGRRSCPPVGRVEHGLHEGDAVEVLRREPWHAAGWFRRSCTEPEVSLDLVADSRDADHRGAEDDPPWPPELVRDEPVSFDPRHRQWEWRSVQRHLPVRVPNPDYTDDRWRRPDPHDVMGAL